MTPPTSNLKYALLLTLAYRGTTPAIARGQTKRARLQPNPFVKDCTNVCTVHRTLQRLQRRPIAIWPVNEQADDEEQHDGADEGNDQAPDVEAGERRPADQAENQAADEGADDADDDVTQDAQPATLHDEARQPTSDATHDDPCQKCPHMFVSLLYRPASRPPAASVEAASC